MSEQEALAELAEIRAELISASPATQSKRAQLCIDCNTRLIAVKKRVPTPTVEAESHSVFQLVQHVLMQ